MSAVFQFWNGFREGITEFGLTVNVLITTFLLLVVYIIGIGITSIVAKCSGKHFLHTDRGKQQDSYWSSLDVGTCPPDKYYKQF